jgi:hypothetical protein
LRVPTGILQFSRQIPLKDFKREELILGEKVGKKSKDFEQ